MRPAIEILSDDSSKLHFICIGTILWKCEDYAVLPLATSWKTSRMINHLDGPLAVIFLHR